MKRSVDLGLVRDLSAIGAAVALVGVSFGAIAVAAGLSPWLAAAMSLLVFAGGSQFAAVAVIASGGSAAAAILAGLALNVRLVPLGLAIAPHLDRSPIGRLLGSHVIADESVAFTLAQPDPRRRRVTFWTTGLVLFAAWNIGVPIGAVAGRAIGNPEALGLDAAFPAALIALLLPSLRRPKPRLIAMAAVVVALIAAVFVPPSLSVLLALLVLPAALLPERKSPQ